MAINCRDRLAGQLILANYDAMQVDRNGNPDLQYEVRWRRNSSQFCLTRQGHQLITASDEGELLFILEKELTIELQKIRHELYFLHAAALNLADKAFLIAAASGTGKSTTAWALLHHGFDYLSDELAPVDLDSLRLERIHMRHVKKSTPAVSPGSANLADVINSARACSATAGFRCFTIDAAEPDVLHEYCSD